ncbi:uncharacterized protein LOC133204598 [Saccostrea echinata]|uniref:uncharacterized protein LOC133204598 n=1 Tax=Saccostrea echinata TaxID=191078 RepID=UPI002A80D26D|nr:uncharacterized protein LOC133204598 [Saccostrea echinata]
MTRFKKPCMLIMVGFSLGWILTYIFYKNALDMANNTISKLQLMHNTSVYTTFKRNVPAISHQPKNQLIVSAVSTTKRSIGLFGDKESGIVYSRSQTKWEVQSSLCKRNTSGFYRATLRIAHGSTPIYIYDPKIDKWVSGSVVKYGSWEGNHINLIIDLLKRDPEIQFVDIGANVGVFTLAVALSGRRVIAVDALDMNIQRLCSSVMEGNFSSRVKLVYNALSDVHETVSLGKDKNNVGGTFVAKNKNANKVRGSQVDGNYGTVRAIKLDDILSVPHFDFKKVIIKIDVEGYENKVFKGGEVFFDKVDVQAILMEWLWLKTGSAGEEIINFMLKKNMEPHIPNQMPSPLKIQDRSKWPNDILWRKKTNKKFL